MGESRSEGAPVSRRLSRRFQVSLVGEGALVGIVGGGIVTLYRLALSHAERLLRTVTGEAAGNALAMLGWFALLGILLAVVWALMRWEPATSGSGIPQVDAEVLGRYDAPWARVIPAKFVEGSLLALSGLSLGREGPSVQLGGMSGKAVSRALRRGRGEERLLVTCGAAAGMSAAFHAPLTGVLFALEEIHKEFSAPLIISVMCSAVASDFLVSQVIGVEPVLSLVFITDLPHVDYLFVVLLGLLCGLLGAMHNQGMFAVQRLYSRIPGSLSIVRLAIPFVLAGVAAFAWPELMCGGDAIVEVLQARAFPSLASLLVLLMGKYLFTAVCFGSGAPGGTLFPLVVLGGLVGGAFSVVAMRLGLPPLYCPNFVALGVAGLFAGVVRAPVTAVVLVFELTGSLDALLSVTIVSILAYVTSSLTNVDAFYEHLLAGLLGTTTDDSTVNGLEGTEKDLATVRVGTGSRLEGMRIREVPWPDGVRVLTIERAGTQIVPTGDTRLMAADELLYIASAEALEDAKLKLALMCEQHVSD